MRSKITLLICITLVLCMLLNSSCGVIGGILVFLAIWDLWLCEWLGERIQASFPNQDPEKWNCLDHPSDLNDDGIDDQIIDDPNIVLSCEGDNLSSWITVNNDVSGYLWGEISINDETKSTSDAIFLPAGIYPGINVMIPVNWEFMESVTYDINYYFCSEEDDVYNKSASTQRLTGERKANISSEKLAYYRQRQETYEFSYEKYNYNHCLLLDSIVNYTILRHGSPVNSIEIIHGGWNPVDSNVVWTLGGNNPSAAVIDSSTGRCSTVAVTPVYGDLLVIATDTVLGLVDTLGIHIIPNIWSYTSCTNYGFHYAKFETGVQDVDRMKAEITAKYGRPCGYYDSSALSGNAKNIMHLSIYKPDTLNVWPLGLFWVQAGHGFMKRHNSTIVDTFFYFETVGERIDTRYHSYQHGLQYPAPNSSPYYKVELKDSGRWYCEAVPGGTYTWPPDSMWLTPGTHIQCTGEINMWENDMGGRHGDTTVFRDIKVGLWGDPVNYYRDIPTYSGDTAHSDDFLEWGIEEFSTNGNIDSFFIWDKRPLP